MVYYFYQKCKKREILVNDCIIEPTSFLILKSLPINLFIEGHNDSFSLIYERS